LKPAVRLGVFRLAFAVTMGVTLLVWRGWTSPWLAVAWFLSLFPIALVARKGPRGRRSRRPPAAALLLFAAALPVLVRVVNLDPDRMHADEFITAYSSATHDFAHSSFFGAIPEAWEWQGQFPKPFFLLQRAFFALFGASVLTLRLSVQIFVAVVSVMLFLIVREMLDQASAFVAVVLYSFLAVSVYMETLGFMFISSTAIFTVFFYFALREYRTGDTFSASLAGVACGFCYLTYYSSYLALPVLLAFSLVGWWRSRNPMALRNLAVALTGMFAVLAPFVAFIARSGNYVSARARQVSLLTGEWSPYRDAIAKGTASPLAVVRDNLKLSLASFARDGIGGHGGYDFGRLAFFDRYSLVLCLAGIAAGLFLLPRKTEILFVFLVVGASFLTGMVLTIPPPAYHRFSIAFPFLVILMTLPFSLVLRLSSLPVVNRNALAAGLLLLFACVNQRQFAEAVFRDRPSDDLRLSELINQRFGGRKLYVAAFQSFAFQKIFYFRDRWKNRPVESAYHSTLLQKLNRREKYVYVMIFADEFRKRFEQADSSGRFIPFSKNYGIFAN
jgi:4-amino-4-deoxy-L-arabinose transferase-like glycosyltransferase